PTSTSTSDTRRPESSTPTDTSSQAATAPEAVTSRTTSREVGVASDTVRLGVASGGGSSPQAARASSAATASARRGMAGIGVPSDIRNLILYQHTDNGRKTPEVPEWPTTMPAPCKRSGTRRPTE